MIELFNVQQLLSLIGCEGVFEERANGWSRCFIRKIQDNGVPLALGRVMFLRGKYSHTKFYAWPENGPIMAKDRLYYDWFFIASTGRAMTDDEWKYVVSNATRRAFAKRKANLEARAKLPKIRPNGKPYGRKRIADANPRGAAYTVVRELIVQLSTIKLILK